LIVTWATIDLGTKLGVSPAKRGIKCTKGLYGIVKHPMYLGYVVAHFGWLFIDFRNIFIYIASLILFYLRAKAENKIIQD
jgi:protein-S-isoprenylcysteine O-methyltransferase Ste14